MQEQDAEEQQAYLEGGVAASRGQPRTVNPYDGRSKLGRAWLAGHRDTTAQPKPEPASPPEPAPEPPSTQGDEPMARERPQYYQAVESFVTTFNGEIVQVSAGDLIHPDDPIRKGRESLFKLAPEEIFLRWTPRVEQATAAPGEKRGA